MLIATRQALAFGRSSSVEAVQRNLRGRLRKNIERGTLAYVDTLTRSGRYAIDEPLLQACRIAAEQQQPTALLHQPLLSHIMATEPGALDGLAALRQDLWRLAHLAICLNLGLNALHEVRKLTDVEGVTSLGTRLRSRFRKALVAYAQAALRSKAKRGRMVMKAREAALAEIGPRGATQAERLADVEASADDRLNILRLGVYKPMMNLALDWQRHAHARAQNSTKTLTSAG